MKHVTHALVLLLFVSILGTALGAHHSLAAAFRLDTTLTLHGTVLQVAFRDPHTYVQLEAREGLHTQRWSLVWKDVRTLAAEGVTYGDLRPGDQIEVSGHPAHNLRTRQLLLRQVSRPADGWSWSDLPQD